MIRDGHNGQKIWESLDIEFKVFFWFFFQDSFFIFNVKYFSNQAQTQRALVLVYNVKVMSYDDTFL